MTSMSGMSVHDDYRTYVRKESIVFLKTKEKYGGLSNMASGYPLRVNDVPIRTSEALYQACRFPHEPDIQGQIISERSPMAAKMRSKKYREGTRSDWNKVRVNIMRWCLRVKLAQNWDQFGGLLRETKDCDIVEQSRRDNFWGAKVLEDGVLGGRNVLGRLLMELRMELKGSASEDLKVIEPPTIPDFLLLGRPIGVVSASKAPETVPSNLGKVDEKNPPQLSLYLTSDN